MHRLVKNIALLVVVLLSATGCFKKVSTATTLSIKVVEEIPVMRQEGDGLKELEKYKRPADGCYAYLYYNTSERDTIMSYEDAAARIITNLDTGEKRSTPDAEGSSSVPEGWQYSYVSLYQESPSALVVVVYPAAQMYAYMRRLSEAENLPTTYLSVVFHTWKSGAYKEGSKEGYMWYVFAPETPIIEPIVVDKPVVPNRPPKPIVPDAPPASEQPTDPEQPTEPETPEGGEEEPSTNN